MNRCHVLFVLLALVPACGGGAGTASDPGAQDVLADVSGPPDGFDDLADALEREVPPADLPPADEGADPAADARLDDAPALPDESLPDLPADLPGPVDLAADDSPSDLPGDTGPAAADPAAAGPFGVAGVSAEVQRGDRTTPVVAHVPIGASGRRPLVLLLPGFQLKTDAYLGLADRLASHGFVVVRADPAAPILGISHVEMAADGVAVLDWALSADGPLAAGVDPARIGVTGHSLGGKVGTMIASRDARVKALFAIDPINAGNPILGYGADLPDIVPEWVAPLAIPLGFAGEVTDKEGANFMSPPCAPEDQNFQTFFAAATASPWVAEWAFEGADHMDFLDDSNCGFTCSACKQGTADPDRVRQDLWTLEVAFFRHHLDGDPAMADWLIGAGVPAGVTVQDRLAP